VRVCFVNALFVFSCAFPSPTPPCEFAISRDTPVLWCTYLTSPQSHSHRPILSSLWLPWGPPPFAIRKGANSLGICYESESPQPRGNLTPPTSFPLPEIARKILDFHRPDRFFFLSACLCHLFFRLLGRDPLKTPFSYHFYFAVVLLPQKHGAHPSNLPLVLGYSHFFGEYMSISCWL